MSEEHRDIVRRLRLAVVALESAREARDQIIREAGAAGVPKKQVMDATGLGRQRVWMIETGKE